MRHTFITLALIASTFGSAQVLAGSAPLDIRVSTAPTQHNIEITALANNLAINAVVMNRGNCEVQRSLTRLQIIQNKPRPRFPVTLQYGQTIQAWALKSQCAVREIMVQTNQGDWTWTFN
ncbi:hypothetical protein VSVS12_02817 [Vibrio scophthalmi]|uniref:hypothetical protein n=1 Tax=Vibrio scophthalmi TaxID=45658 RepID=UPI0008096DD5|nr:hypothetical protein [Vibrio scophthalmi]ANS86556.1 hypothetical protein VSVS12_02817 [Vibrio scophthalmi]